MPKYSNKSGKFSGARRGGDAEARRGDKKKESEYKCKRFLQLGGKKRQQGRFSENKKLSGPSAISKQDTKILQLMRPYPDEEGNALELFGKGAAALDSADMKKYLRANNCELKRRPGVALSMAAGSIRAVLETVDDFPVLPSTGKKESLARSLSDLKKLLSSKAGKSFRLACDYLDTTVDEPEPKPKEDAKEHVENFLAFLTQTKGLSGCLKALANHSSRLYLASARMLEGRACANDAEEWGERFPEAKHIVSEYPKQLRVWLQKAKDTKLLVKALVACVRAQQDAVEDKKKAKSGSRKKSWTDDLYDSAADDEKDVGEEEHSMDSDVDDEDNDIEDSDEEGKKANKKKRPVEKKVKTSKKRARRTSGSSSIVDDDDDEDDSGHSDDSPVKKAPRKAASEKPAKKKQAVKDVKKDLAGMKSKAKPLLSEDVKTEDPIVDSEDEKVVVEADPSAAVWKTWAPSEISGSLSDLEEMKTKVVDGACTLEDFVAVVGRVPVEVRAHIGVNIKLEGRERMPKAAGTVAERLLEAATEAAKFHGLPLLDAAIAVGETKNTDVDEEAKTGNEEK